MCSVYEACKASIVSQGSQTSLVFSILWLEAIEQETHPVVLSVALRVSSHVSPWLIVPWLCLHKITDPWIIWPLLDYSTHSLEAQIQASVAPKLSLCGNSNHIYSEPSCMLTVFTHELQGDRYHSEPCDLVFSKYLKLHVILYTLSLQPLGPNTMLCLPLY